MHIPGSRKIKRMLKDIKLGFLMHYWKSAYANYLYKQTFGYEIDWEHPRDLNEWINYLAFKTDTSDWTWLADKYKVRKYVSDRGLSHILVPLLGVWEKPSDVDFSTLPNSFAIKTNCSSGDVIIVNDKSKVDFKNIRNKMQLALDERDEHFIQLAEPHYLRIKQLIVCEQLIPQPIVDYKVWCFNGKPFGILTCSNRDYDTHKAELNMFDLDWNRHDEWISEGFRNGVEVPKPRHLKEIIDCAKVLSDGFPEVRVDFYDTKEQIFFGEMTFTSYSGRMTYFTPEILEVMGRRVASL